MQTRTGANAGETHTIANKQESIRTRNIVQINIAIRYLCKRE
jgi:hypothetical protein